MNSEDALAVEFCRKYTILLVDSNSTSLIVLAKMLHRCGYSVLTARKAADAFCIIQQKEDELDLVLAEAHLPDMDKFEFLETVQSMSKLPIVIMCADFCENDMLGALFKGAEFYLLKPIVINQLKTLWQFTFTKKKHTGMEGSPSNLSSEVDTKNQKLLKEGEQSCVEAKRKERNEMDDYDNIVLRKPRMTWTSELNHKFLQAVELLGVDEARPKTVLEHMNVPGLERSNVASHLQTYRRALKQQQEAAIGNSELLFTPYDLSLADNSNGGLFPYPETPQGMAICQPQVQLQRNEQNIVNTWTSMPSINNASNYENEVLTLPNHQPYLTYPSTNSNAGFPQMINSNGQELGNDNAGLAGLVESGLGSAMQWQNLISQPQEMQIEAEQQFQQLQQQPPLCTMQMPLQDQQQGGDGEFGTGEVKTNELFDFGDIPPEMFSIDLSDVWSDL